MIFGLFKKETGADIIFTGGKVYTLDPDAPWAETVACKDGVIIAVGDTDLIDELKTDETEIVDLKGGVLLPGFIDACGHPVLQAFSEACLIIYDDMTLEEVYLALTNYIARHPKKQSYFAYGFNPELIASMDKEKTMAALDEICSDKPITLLDISGFQGWFNSKALRQVTKAAEEEAKPPVISLAYILNVLAPIDFDTLQQSVVTLAAEYCEKGYTTVFDCGCPDYLHAVYQEILVEMLQEGLLKQRFMGSLLITRNIDVGYILKKLMQKRINCVEINDFIKCDTLKLIFDTSGENKLNVSSDLLKILSIQASDKGFDVHIDAVGKEAVANAFQAVFLARAAGYKNNHFTIAHSYGLSQEEKTELLLDNELCETSPTLGDFTKKFRGIETAKSVSDAIDKLTIEAAVQLGVSEQYGSIETDKKADFVIFRENPLDCNLPRFQGLSAAMTVIDGKIVYDAEKDNPAKWLKIMSSSHDDFTLSTE